MALFEDALRCHNVVLKKDALHILQVNVGRLCNLTCVHCHVEAGPTKVKDNMDRSTAEAIVRFMQNSGAHTLDITGGAPELNPHFRYLVGEAHKRKLRIIDRCNLTVFYEPGMDDLPEFLAAHRVEIVASLPCYQEANVDQQRGKGTFGKSIDALVWLNRLGYGKEGSGLTLNLVYNPVGAHLPPDQSILEGDYKERLKRDFDIVFNSLYTITNMPITRYAKYLKSTGKYEAYVELLINSFNVATVEGLMCRDTLSVGWDGQLYDCDFNQMLGMALRNGSSRTIHDVQQEELIGSPVLTAQHCFGCTAGFGSSCQGALK